MSLRTIAKRLTQDLQNFGLNPKDWKVKIISRHSPAVVEHRHDPSLRMTGSIRNESWRQLELVGL